MALLRTQEISAWRTPWLTKCGGRPPSGRVVHQVGVSFSSPENLEAHQYGFVPGMPTERPGLKMSRKEGRNISDRTTVVEHKDGRAAAQFTNASLG